jgi:hypothetical protein
MTESTHRTFRRVAIISVLAFALLLPLAVLCLIHLSDSAARAAVDRLRPGMASDEVEEVLADVPHFKITTRSGEEVFVEGLGGYASVKVANGRVTAVERRPDQGRTGSARAGAWNGCGAGGSGASVGKRPCHDRPRQRFLFGRPLRAGLSGAVLRAGRRAGPRHVPIAAPSLFFRQAVRGSHMRFGAVRLILLVSAVAGMISELIMIGTGRPPDVATALLGGLWVAMPYLAAGGLALLFRGRPTPLTALLVALIVAVAIGLPILGNAAVQQAAAEHDAMTAVLPGEDPSRGPAAVRRSGAEASASITWLLSALSLTLVPPVQLGVVLIAPALGYVSARTSSRPTRTKAGAERTAPVSKPTSLPP